MEENKLAIQNELTDEEYKSLRCKIFTLNENGRGQHRKYLPYVFTEYGITMLAGLLKSQVAVNVSIKIVNSFIVIDNKEMYHLGASIKDLGKKCFGINKIEDMEIIERIINI